MIGDYKKEAVDPGCKAELIYVQSIAPPSKVLKLSGLPYFEINSHFICSFLYGRYRLHHITTNDRSRRKKLG